MGQHVDVTEHASVDAFFEYATSQFDRLVGFSAPHRFGVTHLANYKGFAETLSSPTGRVCLVLGSETHGFEFVKPQQLARMDLIYIPIAPAIRSFNLATAAAMGLWEAMRQSQIDQADLVQESERLGLRAPTGRWAGTGPDSQR